MNFRWWLLVWSLSLGALLQVERTRAADKPNIVVILSDDQGWGDLSINGNTNLSTPNIDSLGRDGVIFDRFFVCPVCSPTRAEFLTGRYHPRGGVWSTSTGGERLNLGEMTIAQSFLAAGYTTGAFGKWHNGAQYPYHPNARGFVEYYGFCSGHWGDYFSPPLEHNGQLVRGNGFTADDFTDHALSFIEQHRDVPFFCYLPLNTPHSPMQVPDRFYEKFRNAELKMRGSGPQPENVEFTRAALAMCENIDWNVGRVLKKLDELQLVNNTIVLYFCDNGPNSVRWNGGMKGRKGSTDEGGVRSPLLMRWPGHFRPNSKITHIAGAIDLLPTLTALTGVPIIGDMRLDGINLAPLLMDPDREWPDRMIFSHWNGSVSVRTDRFRLDANEKLFDMQQDPGQSRDVGREHPETAAELTAAVTRWKQELLRFLKNDRVFPVGYRQFPITYLPARDGVPHGNVKRSASAPNCSYFTNWTSSEDSMTWTVEIATTGVYEAVVYYTCSAENVGSTIELSFQNAKWECTVNEAHDPSLRGAENDRVPRTGESYVKDFAPLNMGTVKLNAARGPLTLRAPRVSGKQVMDMRCIVLTLQE